MNRRLDATIRIPFIRKDFERIIFDRIIRIWRKSLSSK